MKKDFLMQFNAHILGRAQMKQIFGGDGGGTTCAWQGMPGIDCTGGTCFLCPTPGHTMCICCSVSSERSCLGGPVDPPGN